MTVEEKLTILSMAAKYDVSCSSSGSSRPNQKRGIGNAAAAGICHSWADDGRCISLLKILYSNNCTYDCAYCVNRKSNDLPRASFTPEEVAELTINFYRRNYIEGLFLSSAVCGSPDRTMELLICAVRILRNEKNFNGYIHLKAIPGASPELIIQAGHLVDRMSANIELPSAQSLAYLAPDKTKDAILGSIKGIAGGIRSYLDERKSLIKVQPFVPAGQSTQLIVGATPDTDKTIITLAQSLYRKRGLKRVYYSAFIPVSTDTRLPMLEGPPLLREHRLYQADWLLRFYGFTAEELLSQDSPDLDLRCDPKVAWAIRNPGRFPIEINRADYEMILRIPGIGVRSAQRIIRARRYTSLTFDILKKLGVIMKRSKYFITCSGKRYDGSLDPWMYRADLLGEKPLLSRKEREAGQLALFPPNEFRMIDHTSVSGEL
jgi:putative DNA modification/repair radical SAM protein